MACAGCKRRKQKLLQVARRIGKAITSKRPARGDGITFPAARFRGPKKDA